MSSSSENRYTAKLDVKQSRVVSDGHQEVILKCTISGRNNKPPKEDIPVTFNVKKQRINETRNARKGTVTYKFKPTRPSGKTRVVCKTPFGEQNAWIFVAPTTYQYVRDLIQAILLAFIVAFGIIRPFILQTFYIPSASMEPTLYENDRLVGFMFTYRFRDPRPGEIVIFNKKDVYTERKIPLGFTTIRWKSYTKYIKRVIAVGGDTVEVKDLTLYINGMPLDEPYIKEPPLRNSPSIKVPEDSFFMMGDNRNNSKDSRSWGSLERGFVVAKAVVRFWPPDRIGFLKQEPIATK